MKVHFAGNGFGGDVLHLANIRYRLESFYDIEKRRACDGINSWNRYEHVIIDSGLFTFMFGADSDKELTWDFAREWQKKYIQFINDTPFRNADFVEMDVQKKLGVQAAWDLRKEMKAKINKGTLINVYHLEDGNPDKLIDHSDYIAISLPELRMNVTPQERNSIINYISRRAMSKGKRVHILGCTELRVMKLFGSVHSCDSTSWLAGVRWGKANSSKGKIGIKAIIDQDKNGKIKDLPQRERDAYWCAVLALEQYRSSAGDQS